MEFEGLSKQYQPMVKQFVRKYKGICEQYLIDVDEIEQTCLIALWKAQEHYNPQEAASFSTYTYNQMEYAIKNLLRSVKPINKSTISIHSSIEYKHGKKIDLIDLIADNLDLQGDIQDRLMIEFYRDEIKRVLPEDKAETLIDKYFLGAVGISTSRVAAARTLLLKKSAIFRNEWKKLKHISEYKPMIIE